MNNKSKKALKIILFSLIGLLSIAIFVVYSINKELALELFTIIKDFLNQPLPIVGITVGAVFVFLWQVFVRTKYGKAMINALKRELAKIKAEHEQYKIDSEKEKEEMRKEIKELRSQISYTCSLSTNKKIKDYGKELDAYGKETIECETKAD